MTTTSNKNTNVASSQQNINIDLSQSASNKEPSISLAKEIKTQTIKWLIITYKIFLSILHVTFIITLASLGDTIVVTVITWSVGDFVNHSEIAKLFLEGIKLFSVFGVTISYTIYLISSLIGDVKNVVRIVREEE